MADLKARSRPGEVFEFELDSNETTGFVWSVESDGGTRCEARYVPDDNPDCLDGTGGREVVDIVADSPGKRTIVLIYSRSPDEVLTRYVVELVTYPEPEVRTEKARIGRRLDLKLDSEGWEVIDSGGLDWTMSVVDGRTVVSVRSWRPGNRRFLLTRGLSKSVEFEVAVEEPETVVELKSEVGDPVVFYLDANPTTGFEWSVVDDGGLRYESDYVPDARSPGICGAGGKQKVALTADSPGAYTFLMSYGRRWEAEPIQCCKAVLTVEPPSQSEEKDSVGHRLRRMVSRF